MLTIEAFEINQKLSKFKLLQTDSSLTHDYIQDDCIKIKLTFESHQGNAQKGMFNH